MGFNRLTDPQYSLERELYFHDKDFDFNVYGNGWDGFKHWRGLLPNKYTHTQKENKHI